MPAISRNRSVLFRIPSDVRYVPMARKGIAAIAESMGFPVEAVKDIELSVSEAVANAVSHGSPRQVDNAVVIICEVTDDALTIDIRDEGPGFQPDSCLKNAGSLQESGRGLTLIYSLMDYVQVAKTRKGSSVRMVKKKTSSLQSLATANTKCKQT
ncbi:MAG: ATP-binding protein [Armatimonadetes bacterium]|nr:ATP-binding protein [Armatimonadota bacterium]